MPPRRKAAGDAEVRVKNIASEEAASIAEMAAAQLLKAASNPTALAPPPPAPSQPATKPNLLEQVKAKNKIATTKAPTKAPQNRTVAGRVQKSKKETPAPRSSSVSKPQPVRKQSASQQSLQKGSVPSPNTSAVGKPQPLERPSASQHSSQGSFRSNASTGSREAVRRPSDAQQNLQDEPSHSPRPPPSRKPSASRQGPQGGPIPSPRTPQTNGHQGPSHPTLFSPGKSTGFYNPFSQENDMETLPVSPSMGSALRRSSTSMRGQAGGQSITLPSQFLVGQPPQMRQLPQMGQSSNLAQLYRGPSFGAGLDNGSGHGLLQEGMQSPHIRRPSMTSQQDDYGIRTIQGQSPHSDQPFRRLSFQGHSNDSSTRLRMQQMLASQSPHKRQYSQQNERGMQVGQGQPRSLSFPPVQQGQCPQSQGFQGQQGYYKSNQQQKMQPQHLAALSYQSKIQQIKNHNQQQQHAYPNPNNGTRPGSQANNSPTMPPPTASRQMNSEPGGLDRLQITTAVKLHDSQGKEDESSASTQVSPERPYDNLKGPSPSNSRPSQNPQAKLVNRRESVSLPSARPTLNRTPSSLSHSMTAIENDEDTEMGGMVEDGSTERQPTSIPQISKPVKSSQSEGPIVSEVNPFGRKQPPKKFTKSDSLTSVTKSFKGGQVQGSSPDPEAKSSPSTTTMRGIVPPTPKAWTNLPLPSVPKSSPPAVLPPRSGINQTEPVNEIDTLLFASLINNNKNGIESGSELSNEERPPSSTIPRSGTDNVEFDIVIQDSIGALLVPRARDPAAEASPKKSIAVQLLEQRHEDALLGFTDYSEEDSRRDGVAAKILASLAGSVNTRSAPRPANTQTRYHVPVDFRDLAIGHLKKTKEHPDDQSSMCSFCNHEEDCGISRGEFLLPLEAFETYCADCRRSQIYFWDLVGNATTALDYVMTEEKYIHFGEKFWRNPSLKEAIDSTGGKETAETYWKAKKLPQNTKCVYDGKDVSRYRGSLTCRGSPHGQVDVTKAKICQNCMLDKCEIIKHVKHTTFKPHLHQSRGLQHSQRCMVCTNPNLGIYKCDSCPLRLCNGCQTMLKRMCKGYLDILLYHKDREHIRNDAFLLRSDGGGF